MDKIGGDALVEWTGAGEKAVAFPGNGANVVTIRSHWLPRLQKGN